MAAKGGSMTYEEEDNIEGVSMVALDVNWHDDDLVVFVEKANIIIQEANVPKPDWLHLPGGQINLNSFIGDVIRELQVAGGVKIDPTDTCVLGPHTIAQYSRILFELANIQSHPFMQTVIKEVLRANPAFRGIGKLFVSHSFPDQTEVDELGPYREPPFIYLFD